MTTLERRKAYWADKDTPLPRLIGTPLVAMEGTLLRYMALTPQQSFEAVLGCVTRCRLAGEFMLSQPRKSEARTVAA
jgi:hypothetical protein